MKIMRICNVWIPESTVRRAKNPKVLGMKMLHAIENEFAVGMIIDIKYHKEISDNYYYVTDDPHLSITTKVSEITERVIREYLEEN